jgi:hypothetical protein
MSDEATEVWQDLMHEAYESWRAEDMSYEEFLDELDGVHRRAVILGNLNYQVNNGGFAQWVDNRYGGEDHQIARVIRALGRVDTASTRKTIELLQKVREALRDREESGCSMWDDEEDPWEVFFHTVNSLDYKFYDLKDFEEDVGNYFRDLVAQTA